MELERASKCSWILTQKNLRCLNFNLSKKKSRPDIFQVSHLQSILIFYQHKFFPSILGMIWSFQFLTIASSSVSVGSHKFFMILEIPNFQV